jgi:ribosomal RNA-processing protein 1
MWMSDKPRNQQQLARDLAGLIDVLRDGAVLPFLEGFWDTMAREWGGIDVLR